MPAKWLVDFLNMHWKGIEGEYYSSAEKLLAFDPSVRTKGPSALLLNEEALTVLRRKGYDIVWLITGEKMLIGGRMPHEEWKGRLELGGLFRKKNDKIEGFIKSTFDEPLK